MSWLSSATGVHISPKGVRIEPLKALGTLATVGSMGALGPIAGALGAIPGVGAIAGAAKAIPGVSAIGGALSHLPGAGAVGGLLKGVGGAGAQQGGFGGLLKGAADYAIHNPLDVLGGINSAVDAGHARDLQGKAEGLALDNYNQRAGLRTAGVKGLLNPVVPDLSGINYGSTGSVYGKKRAVA